MNCPKCNNPEGFYYRDYGNIIEYCINNEGKIDASEIYATKKAPKYCRCSNCNHRILIKEAMDQEKNIGQSEKSIKKSMHLNK